MRKLPLVLLLALLPALGGCATVARLEAAWQSVKSATVSPAGVVVTAKIFDALEATATNYLKLNRCSATSGPICRSPAVTPRLVQAVHDGRAARNSLLAFQQAHPGQLGDQGVYDALQAAIATITVIVNDYIGATS